MSGFGSGEPFHIPGQLCGLDGQLTPGFYTVMTLLEGKDLAAAKDRVEKVS